MTLNDTPPTPPRYVTLADAASYLGVTPKTVRRFVADGRLTAYRLGKRMLRVDMNEIEALPCAIPNA